jgi:hypothetical protein
MERLSHYHTVCDDPRPREIARETTVIAVEGGRVTVSEGADPISKGNGCRVTKRGRVEVTKEAEKGSASIKPRDGLEIKTMKLQWQCKVFTCERNGKRR